MSKAVSTLTLQKYKKDGRKIVALTAYDYSMAKILDRAGVDLILVGDSLAMVALGHRTTHAVTMEEMLHHTRAVTRGVSTAMVVADLPFMSYQVDVTQAIMNAGRFVKEAQAHAVKLEGATRLNLEIIERLVGMGIPVMGHLGYTPQAIHGLGGARVQGRSADQAIKLLDDARALEMAGCFSVVLEMVPTAVAKMVTEKLNIPTVGIGAGNACDGQILVTDDLLGKFTDFLPRFVRRYADLSTVCQEAVASYAADVKSGDFPNASESFLLPKDEEAALNKQLQLDKSVPAGSTEIC
ncbi:MAG TPA: 3-methyl-2-oxobutanoate hydroxymethyltransferase [Candidatus Obscuribacter sp.]|nr:3-methyl-2-oxobutanoate hydroxymethyltransferase [Candidatus Obscuribacter sp.]HMX46871.1 3-methyl-2-oxobutanoate hydroxymethyltransferase [Candidatus Obscuribacter sp.]HNA72672.1 3-methyl-2-oxobutanoate hydroxymethyltransferase [Candidatus Obscuribacter sp.]HND07300.1 3-methyl-2-oxobutanoate hydroxymethyltransferase [Candidatus Obscuribacter sp.]HNG77187.1 3-methyl-2-oxobutanoate hydroxymethyltransferase [Candidatus Obscuribacter sp.]